MHDPAFDAQAYLDQLPAELRPAYRVVMDAEAAFRAAKKALLRAPNYRELMEADEVLRDAKKALRDALGAWSCIMRERDGCHS